MNFPPTYASPPNPNFSLPAAGGMMSPTYASPPPTPGGMMSPSYPPPQPWFSPGRMPFAMPGKKSSAGIVIVIILILLLLAGGIALALFFRKGSSFNCDSEENPVLVSKNEDFEDDSSWCLGEGGYSNKARGGFPDLPFENDKIKYVSIPENWCVYFTDDDSFKKGKHGEFKKCGPFEGRIPAPLGTKVSSALIWKKKDKDDEDENARLNDFKFSCNQNEVYVASSEDGTKGGVCVSPGKYSKGGTKGFSNLPEGVGNDSIAFVNIPEGMCVYATDNDSFAEGKHGIFDKCGPYQGGIGRLSGKVSSLSVLKAPEREPVVDAKGNPLLDTEGNPLTKSPVKASLTKVEKTCKPGQILAAKDADGGGQVWCIDIGKYHNKKNKGDIKQRFSSGEKFPNDKISYLSIPKNRCVYVTDNDNFSPGKHKEFRQCGEFEGRIPGKLGENKVSSLQVYENTGS